MLINFFEKQQNSKICKTKLYSLVENNYEDQKNKIGLFLEKMTGEAIVTKFFKTRSFV